MKKCQYCGKRFRVVLLSSGILWCSYECADKDLNNEKNACN